MKALLSAGLALLGYGIACFVLMFFVGSEALAAAFMIAVLFSPVVLICGAVAGSAFTKAKTSTVGTLVFCVGVCLPIVIVFVWSATDDLRRTSSNAAYARESRQAFDKAKANGFPFPSDAEPTMMGDASTGLSTQEAIAFYDSATARSWKSHKYGKSAWYVRPSTGGMTDQMVVSSAYQRTVISYRKLDETGMRLAVANAFSGACASSEWAVAKGFCSPGLQAKLADGGIQGMLGNVRPSSSAFGRKVFPSGAKSQIAVNAHRDLGGNSFQTSEVGFEFTHDTIPLIDEIEISGL